MKVPSWIICLVVIVKLSRGQDENEESQKLLPITKCCQANEVFDMAKKECIPWDLSEEHWPDYPIEPNHVDSGGGDSYYYDQYLDYSTRFDDEEQESFAGVEKVEVARYGMESCGANASLHYVSIPDNDINAADFLIFEDNGHHVLFDYTESKDYMEYCLDRGYQYGRYFGTVAVVCKIGDDIYCKHNPCLRICCPAAQFIHPETNTCQDIQAQDDPEASFKPVLQDYQGNNDTEAMKKLRYIYDDLACKNSYSIESKERGDFKFLTDGHLVFGGTEFGLDELCIDNVEERIGNDSYYFHPVAHICAPDNECSEGFLKWQCIVNFKLVPALFVVSCLFIALLGWHIWLTQRYKLFGCMMMSFCLMLFIFYLVLGKVKLSSAKHSEDEPELCEVEGLWIQFSYLSAIFWLNAMSFFIWRIFRKIQAPNAPLNQDVKIGFRHKQYKWYALYAWGVPLIVTGVTLLMQHLPKELTKDLDHYTPGLAEGQCFLDNNLPRLFYFHIITIPVLVSNVVLFFLFLWSMLCGVWSDHDGDPVMKQQNKKRMKAVIKMFFVMGITWIMEFVSWILEITVGSHKVHKIVFVFDLINSLQGVILFCVIYFDSDRIKKHKEQIGRCFRRQRNPEPEPQSELTMSTKFSSMSSYRQSWRRVKSAMCRANTPSPMIEDQIKNQNNDPDPNNSKKDDVELQCVKP